MALAELNETVAARGAEYPLRGRYDARFAPVVAASFSVQISVASVAITSSPLRP